LSDYRHPDRFLGLDDASSGREGSAAWLLPIPLDMTTSYVGGTRFGPAAIIEASNQVELYDSMVGVEAAPLYGIHTLPFFHPTLASAVEAFEAIAETVADLPLKGRLLVTLGGEHSIMPGVVRALSPEYRDLVLVQIDAHCDLRDSFDGTPWSHACAARRALDHVAKILQFGIRSVCPEEVEFLRSTDRVKVWTAEAMYRDAKRRYLDELRKAINGRPVYLSIDLDGLDPSVVSAVGTPEPGGIGWYDCLDLIRAVTESGPVIAFDCVELCPAPGNQASAFAAAKLVYKTLNHVMLSRGKLGAESQ
jgi:agmatinase